MLLLAIQFMHLVGLQPGLVNFKSLAVSDAINKGVVLPLPILGEDNFLEKISPTKSLALPLYVL